MKNTRWTLLAALVMTAPAFAQSSSSMTPEQMQQMQQQMSGAGAGAPGAAAPGGTAATADSGAITNATVTETTTTTEGIGPDGISVAIEPGMETTELANTGGAPIAMSLLGLSMAMGAFALRRRV